MDLDSGEKVWVLIDGNCNLCNGLASYLQKYNTRQTLLFVPLQSLQGGHSENSILLNGDFTTTADSLHVLANGRVYTGSEAALQIVAQMPGLWKILLVFRLVPRIFRDWIYGFVAKNRYKWFGKTDECNFYHHSLLHQNFNFRKIRSEKQPV